MRSVLPPLDFCIYIYILRSIILIEKWIAILHVVCVRGWAKKRVMGKGQRPQSTLPMLSGRSPCLLRLLCADVRSLDGFASHSWRLWFDYNVEMNYYMAPKANRPELTGSLSKSLTTAAALEQLRQNGLTMAFNHTNMSWDGAFGVSVSHFFSSAAPLAALPQAGCCRDVNGYGCARGHLGCG